MTRNEATLYHALQTEAGGLRLQSAECSNDNPDMSQGKVQQLSGIPEQF